MKGTASLDLPSVIFVHAKKAAVPSGAMNSWSAAIFDTIAQGLSSHRDCLVDTQRVKDREPDAATNSCGRTQRRTSSGAVAICSAHKQKCLFSTAPLQQVASTGRRLQALVAVVRNLDKVSKQLRAEAAPYQAD